MSATTVKAGESHGFVGDPNDNVPSAVPAATVAQMRELVRANARDCITGNSATAAGALMSTGA